MHNCTCSQTHRFAYALLVVVVVVVVLWRFNDRADVKLLLLHLPLHCGVLFNTLELFRGPYWPLLHYVCTSYKYYPNCACRRLGGVALVGCA